MKVALFLLGILVFHEASAQSLGRLFFTEDQREALDARRKARVPDKPAAAPVTASPITRLDGFVKRSRGPDTVWVNGEPLPQEVRPGERSVSIPLGEGVPRWFAGRPLAPWGGRGHPTVHQRHQLRRTTQSSRPGRPGSRVTRMVPIPSFGRVPGARPTPGWRAHTPREGQGGRCGHGWSQSAWS